MQPMPTKRSRTFAPGSPWREAFGLGNSSREDSLLPEHLREPTTCSTELHGLLGVTEVVRSRVLANRFLGGWMAWLSWVLVGLMVGAAIGRRLTPVVVAGATLAVVGALYTLLRAWLKRPSPYSLARSLDAVSGLEDRLSTAWYFGAIENPDPMILRQRRDALDRLRQLDPRALFPVELPAFASRTLALALIAAALLAYRIHYNAPIAALVQRAVHSQVEKVVI